MIDNIKALAKEIRDADFYSITRRADSTECPMSVRLRVVAAVAELSSLSRCYPWYEWGPMCLVVRAAQGLRSAEAVAAWALYDGPVEWDGAAVDPEVVELRAQLAAAGAEVERLRAAAAKAEPQPDPAIAEAETGAHITTEPTP